MFSVKYKKFFLIFSAIMMMAALAVIVKFGLRPSLEFTGGSLMEVSYTETLEVATIEAAVADLDYGSLSVRAAGNVTPERESFHIRTRSLSDEERSRLETAVKSLGESAEVERFTSVGPSIGSELQQKSYWAIGMVILVITLYIAYAFLGVGRPVSSFAYGGITVLSLVHDIIIPIALMSLMGYYVGAEADILFVMAILAVLGYSVNDTVVVFDRVRENIRLNRTEKRVRVTEPGGMVREEVEYTLTKPFAEIIGSAVTQSVARSINTSLTTALVLVGLYFLGGDVTQNFALILLVGVIAGVYSSLFLAAPLLLVYHDWRESRDKTVKK